MGAIPLNLPIADLRMTKRRGAIDKKMCNNYIGYAKDAMSEIEREILNM
jgi:hypothetical protein